MGIDPATADHVVDDIDQQIEVAVARVEKLISVAQETAEPLGTGAQAAIVEKLQGATEQIEQAVERVDTIAAPVEKTAEMSDATVGLALAEPTQATGQQGETVEQGTTTVAPTAQVPGPIQRAEPEVIVDNLNRVTQRFKEAVQDVETLAVAAQEESRGAHAAEKVRQ